MGLLEGIQAAHWTQSWEPCSTKPTKGRSGEPTETERWKQPCTDGHWCHRCHIEVIIRSFFLWITNCMFKAPARNIRLAEISLSNLLDCTVREVARLPLKAFVMASFPPQTPEMTQILCQRKHGFKIMGKYLQDHYVGGSDCQLTHKWHRDNRRLFIPFPVLVKYLCLVFPC